MLNLKKDGKLNVFTVRSWPAWSVLVVGLMLTVFLTLSLINQRHHSADLQFELHVNELRNDIDKRLTDHEQILLGGAGLFDVKGNVTRGEWRQFTERLELSDRYPGIQGVGYSQVILPDELDDHVASLRQEGFSDYSVRPEGERELYTAIVYLEPFSDRNLAAFGYDMFSQSVRREAMTRAVGQARTTITGKVTLVQETHGRTQAGFLMYVPIYRTGQPLDSATERWASLQGYVYSPYRMDDLMAGILGGRNLLVDFTLHDGAAITPETLMYDSAAIRDSVVNDEPSHLATRTINAYGREWTLNLRSRPAFQAQFVTPLGWLLPALGTSISLVLFAMALILLNHRHRALALAEDMTRQRVESDERFKQLFLRMGQGVLIRNEEGAFLDANPAALRILGLSLSQLNDTTFVQRNVRLIEENGLDFPMVNSPFHVAVREGRAVSGTVMGIEYLNEEREKRWLEVDAYPLAKKSDSSEIGIFEVFSDVTDQRAALDAVRQAEQFLSSVLEAASEFSIIATDPHGMITVFNKGAEQMLGYRSDDMVAKSSPAILHVPEEVQARSLELTAELGRPVEGFRVFVERAEQNGAETREWTYVHKDGHTIPVSLVVTTIEDSQGGIAGYLGISQDITERKRLDRMKSEFVSTVSHELRTPLTSISGALGLLVSGRLGDIPKRAESMLETAHRNSLRLGFLINDLLDIEKLASGEIYFDMKSQPLLPLLEGSIEENQTYAVDRQVAFSLSCPDTGIQVRVDGQRLMQVVANLLSNAIKFSPDGGAVIIDVECKDDRVIVSVKDQGPGVPDAFKARIFEKFTQADASDTRGKEGTGLGLAIAREMLGRMGGTIDFESTPGQGARFYFDLPLVDVSDQRMTSTVQEWREERSILVVDDEPDIARLLKVMLSEAGYQVDIAHSGADAIQAIEQGDYDLVTMDLDLSGEDGLDVIHRIRDLDGLSDLPVVVVSANVETGRLAMSGDVSDIEWLAKPIDQRRLIDNVQKRLVEHSGQTLSVLHVEDDEDLHQVIVEMLGKQFNTVLARNLSEARVILEQASFDVVILDIGLPDGTGWELLPAIRSCQQEARVVVLSGNELESTNVGKVEAVLLKSRVTPKELLHAIEARIRRSRNTLK